MRIKKIFHPFLLFFIVTLVFFYQVVFRGYSAFPGDLLTAEYNPWKSFSYLGYNPGSFPNKAQYFDTIRQLYPWRTLTIAQVQQNEIPLWNPYSFSGAPLLANIQSAVFYPGTVLYLFLPQITAWNMTVLLQPLLACLFMYLFAKQIGIGKKGSILTALAYGYSLYMTVFLEYNTIGHIVMLLPLTLWLFEKMQHRARGIYAILFSLSVAITFFAGHLQLAVLNILFVFLYAGFQAFITGDRKKNLKGFVMTSSLLGIGGAIAAIQLVPTVELLMHSARTAQPYDFLINILLIQPKQLLMVFSPDIFGNPATRSYLLQDAYPGKAMYIGFVPLIFAFAAIMQQRNETKVRFFIGAVVTLLVLLVHTPFTKLFYLFPMPLFSSSAPTNALYLLSFSLSILAGFGLEAWIHHKDEKRWKLILLPCGIFLVGVALLYLCRQEFNFKNIMYTGGLMVIMLTIFVGTRLLRIKRTFVSMLFIVITVIDLFYFFHKFNPFVPSQLVFPESAITTWLQENSDGQRFWGYGSAAIEANFATQYHIYSPDGYDPLYPKHYGAFMQLSKNGKFPTGFTNQTRSDAVITPGFGETDLAENEYRLRIMDALSVRYVLDRVENGSTEKTYPSSRFQPRFKEGGWTIYENTQSAQRVFLTSSYVTYTDEHDFSKKLFATSFDPREMVLLNKQVAIDSKEAAENNNVQIKSYTPNAITMHVSSAKKQLLVLTDTFYPGWKAIVNGKEVPILRANYTFRAIVVPQGDYTVAFIYQPFSFTLGLWISIISLIVLSSVVYLCRRISYET